MKARYRFRICSLLAAGGLLCFLTPAIAYIEAAMSLGSIVDQCSNIVLMRVESVDKEKSIIIYRKVRDIKGKHNGDVIKHNIGKGGLRANEWKHADRLGRAGQDWPSSSITAAAASRASAPGGISVLTRANGGSTTTVSRFCCAAIAGPSEKLANIVAGMLEGREMIATCMATEQQGRPAQSPGARSSDQGQPEDSGL